MKDKDIQHVLTTGQIEYILSLHSKSLNLVVDKIKGNDIDKIKSHVKRALNNEVATLSLNLTTHGIRLKELKPLDIDKLIAKRERQLKKK